MLSKKINIFARLIWAIYHSSYNFRDLLFLPPRQLLEMWWTRAFISSLGYLLIFFLKQIVVICHLLHHINVSYDILQVSRSNGFSWDIKSGKKPWFLILSKSKRSWKFWRKSISFVRQCLRFRTGAKRVKKPSFVPQFTRKL